MFLTVITQILRIERKINVYAPKQNWNWVCLRPEPKQPYDRVVGGVLGLAFGQK
jgi:hypothetical protein